MEGALVTGKVNQIVTNSHTRRCTDRAIRLRSAIGLLTSLLLSLVGPVGVSQVVAADLQPVWNQVSTSGPAASTGTTMAFDEATGQMLLFGGNGSGGNSNETWQWDGANWHKLTPSTSPSVRTNASMAYDPATGQLILFGGKGTDYLGDTWVWDGTNWSQASTSGPASRANSGMTYDPATQQLLLFGGRDSIGQFGDTWAWNGTRWTEMDSSGPVRADSSMAYDPASHQILLFGGFDGTNLGDTWSWNGSSWDQVSTSGPAARRSAKMAFSEATGQLLLFGGWVPQTGNIAPFDDTWTWDGANWIQLTVNGPSGRYLPSMAYDPATGQMVLFGGTNYTDTWSYAIPANANVWQDVNGSGLSTQAGATMAYDPQTAQLLLYGSNSNGTQLGTWGWSGSNWNQLSTDSPDPYNPPAGHSNMAYDPATGQMLRVSGFSNQTYKKTFEWDGSSWTQISTTSSPLASEDTVMAYDPATGQLVLFASGLLQTWTWNGSDWTLLSPTTSPPARNSASMAYDPATAQLILFGGFDGNVALGDTWTWDGSSWTQLTSGRSPSGRFNANMAFDPAIGKLIIFGGFDGTNNVQDTWAWTGSGWQLINNALLTPPSYGAAMTFDPATAQLVVFGGSNGIASSDTWTLVPVNDTSPPTTEASATNADTTAYTFGDWTNQAVTVSLFAADPGGAGVASTDYHLDTGQPSYTKGPYTRPITISSDGDHTFEFGSTDIAGNHESRQTVNVRIDQTAPDASGGPTTDPNGNGWYNAPVTIHFACSDPLSGVAYCPHDQTILSEGTGLTVSDIASDNVGNHATVISDPPVNVDLTAPTVSYTGNQGSYALSDTVNITCSAADELSGVDSSTCTSTSAPASSFLFGTNTISATATDKAGNVGEGSAQFTVNPPDSTAGASLTAFNFSGTRLIAFVRMSRSGTRPSGFLTYDDGSVHLTHARLASLTVETGQATLYGNAQLTDGTPVSFSLAVSQSTPGSTIRLHLSNGYDSGGQTALFVRMSP